MAYWGISLRCTKSVIVCSVYDKDSNAKRLKVNPVRDKLGTICTKRGGGQRGWTSLQLKQAAQFRIRRMLYFFAEPLFAFFNPLQTDAEGSGNFAVVEFKFE